MGNCIRQLMNRREPESNGTAHFRSHSQEFSSVGISPSSPGKICLHTLFGTCVLNQFRNAIGDSLVLKIYKS